MRYYFDTSAIYEIKRLPKSVLDGSYYSVFSVIEIIAGLDPKSLTRRKAALTNLFNTGIDCDRIFPEHTILRAFDHFNAYGFTEERVQDLFSLAGDLIATSSFEEFTERDQQQSRQYPFAYFVELDKRYSKGFIEAAQEGKSQMEASLRDETGENMVSLEGKSYRLHSRRNIINFLGEGLINDSITIAALAHAAILISGESYSDELHEKVYGSYNGSLGQYLKGYSNYSVKQIGDNSMPDRNDAQDMTHLLYLGTGAGMKILSNDNFFSKAVPGLAVTIDEALLDTIAALVGVKNEPLALTFMPAKWAKENDCFNNVAAQVKRHGGECVFGWQVWKLPFMLEAEFHAVWLSPDGAYIDITPNTMNHQPARQFWRDTQKVFEGKQVNNIRLNTTSNGLVDDLIALQDFKFFLENKGDNAFRYDSIELNEGEIRAWNFTKDMIGHLQAMIYSKSRPDSICFCGTGNPYNQCHGQDLKEGVRQMEAKIRSYSNL